MNYTFFKVNPAFASKFRLVELFVVNLSNKISFLVTVFAKPGIAISCNIYWLGINRFSINYTYFPSLRCTSANTVVPTYLLFSTAVSINGNCSFDEECEASTPETTCKENVCICRSDKSPSVFKDHHTECICKY